MFLKRKYAWTIILSWLLFSACGYRFPGSGSLPSGIKSISIKMFENRSVETGVENVITNDLIYEFTRHDRAVVTSGDMADAILAGVVKSMSTVTISHRGEYTSNERRVEVKVDLQLTDKSGGVIWSAKDVSDNQEYKIMSDKQSTERNRKAAIERLSKKLSEKIYNSLTVDF